MIAKNAHEAQTGFEAFHEPANNGQGAAKIVFMFNKIPGKEDQVRRVLFDTLNQPIIRGVPRASDVQVAEVQQTYSIQILGQRRNRQFGLGPFKSFGASKL